MVNKHKSPCHTSAARCRDRGKKIGISQNRTLHHSAAMQTRLVWPQKLKHIGAKTPHRKTRRKTRLVWPGLHMNATTTVGDWHAQRAGLKFAHAQNFPGRLLENTGTKIDLTPLNYMRDAACLLIEKTSFCFEGRSVTFGTRTLNCMFGGSLFAF